MDATTGTTTCAPTREFLIRHFESRSGPAVWLLAKAKSGALDGADPRILRLHEELHCDPTEALALVQTWITQRAKDEGRAIDPGPSGTALRFYKASEEEGWCNKFIYIGIGFSRPPLCVAATYNLSYDGAASTAVMAPAVEPAVDPPMDPAVHPVVGGMMDPPVDPALQPVGGGMMDPPVDPALQPVVGGMVDPPVDPALHPVGGMMDPPADPALHPVVGGMMDPPVDPSVAVPTTGPRAPATTRPMHSLRPRASLDHPISPDYLVYNKCSGDEFSDCEGGEPALFPRSRVHRRNGRYVARDAEEFATKAEELTVANALLADKNAHLILSLFLSLTLLLGNT